jgi:WD40 repeat protein
MILFGAAAALRSSAGKVFFNPGGNGMKENPYVGPRPYERGDQKNFYGREREARELQALITAEREVLVYAQSGAGKTSLLNARVIPSLEEQGFIVLPVTRVGNELPPSVSPAEVENIFIFSALLSLTGEHSDPRALLNHSLADYLRALLSLSSPTAAGQEEEDEDNFAPPHPPVLIFDQFEELFTTHRDRWQDARGFFTQVRQALEEIPGLGVVFSMREDHAAALDPYLSLFPNRLRARFRMQLLGARGALHAISRPAAGAGLPFASGVAERLVDDLRRIKITTTADFMSVDEHVAVSGDSANGQPEESVLGEVIEPVQLQVVCAQLWNSLPEDKDGQIQWEEVERYGSVDQALIAFYEDSVRRAAMETGVHERQVRRWFGSQMITSVFTRGLVLRGPKESAGLPNEAVDILENTHLIRAEIRAGARWYELSHDRLVDPILTSNRSYERVTETPLRGVARQWKETGNVSLLYRGAALREAQQSLEDFDTRPVYQLEPEPFELEFIQASRKAEDAARQRRIIWILTGAVAVLLLVIMAGLSVFAFNQSEAAQTNAQEAEKQRNTAIFSQNLAYTAVVQMENQASRARAREIASYAASSLSQNQFQRGLLLALQSIGTYQQTGVERFVPGEQVLRDALARMRGKSFICGDRPLDILLSTSPDGRWLSGVSTGERICIWDLEASVPGYFDVPPHIIEGPYTYVNFSPDSRWLIGLVMEWDQPLKAYLWELNDFSRAPLVFTIASFTESLLPIQPNGRWMASYSGETAHLIDLFSPNPLQNPIRLPDMIDPKFLFSPDNRWMLAYEYEGLSILFDLARLQDDPSMDLQAVQIRLPGFVNAAFSPGGEVLATLREGDRSRPIDVMELTIPADGAFRVIDLWDLREVQRYATSGFQQPVASINFALDDFYVSNEMLFSPDGRWLTARPGRTSVLVWELETGFFAAPALSSKLETPNGFDQLEFSADSCWLASKGEDGYLWPLYRGKPIENPVQVEMQGIPSDFTFAAPESTSRFVRFAAALDDLFRVQVMDLFTIRSPGEGCGGRISGDGSANGSVNQVLIPLQLEGHQGSSGNLTFLSQGRWVLYSSDSGAWHIWDLEAASTTVSPGGYNLSEIVQKPLVAPDGRLFMLGETMIQLWLPDADTDRPQVVLPSPKEEETFSSAALSPDGLWLAAGTDFGRVWLWSTERLNEPPQEVFLYFGALRSQPSFSYDAIITLTFSPDSRWLAVQGQNIAAVWPVGSSDPANTIQVLENMPVSFDFDPLGRWLVAIPMIEENSVLQFWQESGGVFELSAAFELGQFVDFLRMSPDGDYLVVTSTIFKKDHLSLWDLRGFEPGPGSLQPPVKELDHKSYLIDSALFSPQNKWLLTQSNNGEFYFLWDLATLSAAPQSILSIDLYSQMLLAEEGGGYEMAFSPNDRWLAVGGNRGKVRLWELANLEQGPVLLRGPSSNIIDLKFVSDENAAPESYYLLSASENGAIRFWPMETGEIVRLACQQLYRGLTDQERLQYLQNDLPLTVCP